MLRIITNNWSLKLTALVLAVALWSHVQGEVNPPDKATFRVRLDVNPPKHMMVADESKIPREVLVTLLGPRLTLRKLGGLAPPNPLAPAEEVPRLDDERVRAWLDFSSTKGEQNVPVKAELSADLQKKRVEWISANPPVVAVVLESVARKRFPVKAQFSPPLSPRHRVARVVVQPAVAEVSGPSGLVSRVASVRARADGSAAASGALEATSVALEAVDKAGVAVAGARVEPALAEVTVTVRAATSGAAVARPAD